MRFISTHCSRPHGRADMEVLPYEKRHYNKVCGRKGVNLNALVSNDAVTHGLYADIRK